MRKRWKSRAFAAGVNRDVVEKGAAMLGTSLDALAQEVIDALRERRDEIGL